MYKTFKMLGFLVSIEKFQGKGDFILLHIENGGRPV